MICICWFRGLTLQRISSVRAGDYLHGLRAWLERSFLVSRSASPLRPTQSWRGWSGWRTLPQWLRSVPSISWPDILASDLVKSRTLMVGIMSISSRWTHTCTLHFNCTPVSSSVDSVVVPRDSIRVSCHTISEHHELDYKAIIAIWYLMWP